ncbi:hypothetical protein HDU67_004093 [Dinochytrium kinnereticum]|nr:hypothetical protein HDU67_004093 [Dinochytrium kinnereticum]
MGNSNAKHLSEDVEVDLRHFNLLRCVGKGAFGKVRIVEKRDTRKLYALKYINKQQCVRMRAIQNIFRERAILEEISHPYIVNLRYAFQDDDNMFMVLDLMMGGDLRYHLDRMGGFREEAVRVMACELASALNYLHRNKIVHRDLKPDNILFDDSGHVHLTDFNIAVKFVGRNALKSHSGTLAYMAPEIFGESGYLWQIDWWSLGVCLFECLYGKRPFRGNSNEALTQAIRKQPLNLPDNNYVSRQPVHLSKDCASFLRGLLERNVDRRLGSKGFDSIRRHPWLGVFEWDRVERKDMRPIFVPEPNRSNFDASYDLEELLLEDNPLKYKPRKKKPAKAPDGTTNPTSNTTTTATSTTTTTVPGRNNFIPGRRKAASTQSSQNGAFTIPLFDPRAMGRNRSVGGGGVQTPGMTLTGTGVGGVPATAVDRTTAELQFIEENFRTYDFTLVAAARRANAVQAAANAAAAAQSEAAAVAAAAENGGHGFGGGGGGAGMTGSQGMSYSSSPPHRQKVMMQGSGRGGYQPQQGYGIPGGVAMSPGGGGGGGLPTLHHSASLSNVGGGNLPTPPGSPATFGYPQTRGGQGWNGSAGSGMQSPLGGGGLPSAGGAAALPPIPITTTSAATHATTTTRTTSPSPQNHTNPPAPSPSPPIVHHLKAKPSMGFAMPANSSTTAANAVANGGGAGVNMVHSPSAPAVVSTAHIWGAAASGLVGSGGGGGAGEKRNFMGWGQPE